MIKVNSRIYLISRCHLYSVINVCSINSKMLWPLVFFAGGIQDVLENTQRKFTSGFVGCISDLTLAEDYPMKLVEKAQSGRNVHSCSVT